MVELAVVSLTAALRASGVRSVQSPLGGGGWRVDAAAPTLYTMATLANLGTTHGVTVRTDRAEFGPATEAQAAALSAALRGSNVDHTVSQRADGFYIRAGGGSLYPVADVQALETAHGVPARSNRAVFE